MSQEAAKATGPRPGTRGVVRALSVAPMMDRSDAWFRRMMRHITRHTLLYTEMITTQAILRGGVERHLAFSELEGPLALQLGGDDPQELRQCARLAEDLGYDEINLNVGCPSSRVQRGSFGVCLMGRPEVVAEAVAEMRAEVALPVTVKHRIGFDEIDRYEDMLAFVDTVAAAGCDRFTVHARKAWLQGLSPKENRNVPPLRYGDVRRLKAERPGLVVELNGGIVDLETARAQLDTVDAVMIGRAAWDRPWLFAEADPIFFGQAPPAEAPEEVARAMVAEVARARELGLRAHTVVRPMLGLFHGQPGARAWKRVLTERSQDPDADESIVEAALAALTAARRPRPPAHEALPAG